MFRCFCSILTLLISLVGGIGIRADDGRWITPAADYQLSGLTYYNGNLFAITDRNCRPCKTESGLGPALLLRIDPRSAKIRDVSSIASLGFPELLAGPDFECLDLLAHRSGDFVDFVTITEDTPSPRLVVIRAIVRANGELSDSWVEKVYPIEGVDKWLGSSRSNQRIEGCAVRSGAIYLATEGSSKCGPAIFRTELANPTLGEPWIPAELFAGLPEARIGKEPSPSGLAFTANGRLLILSRDTERVLVVHPDLSIEPFELNLQGPVTPRPDAFSPEGLALAGTTLWIVNDPDPKLYAGAGSLYSEMAPVLFRLQMPDLASTADGTQGE